MSTYTVISITEIRKVHINKRIPRLLRRARKDMIRPIDQHDRRVFDSRDIASIIFGKDEWAGGIPFPGRRECGICGVAAEAEALERTVEWSGGGGDTGC